MRIIDLPTMWTIVIDSLAWAVIQPGGSVRDQDSVDYCDANGMAMVFTGTRHFKH